MKFLLIPVCIFCLFFIGCDASSKKTDSPVSLSEPAISEQVDETTKAPIKPASSFTSSVKTLNASVKLNHVPANTVVKARFYYGGKNSRREIASDTVTTGGTGYVNFALNPPKSGWPSGVYQVEFFLGDDMKEQLQFTIQKNETASTVKKGLANATQQEARFKRFRDKQFGFSLELPRDWKYQVIGQHGDYLFKGPKGSDLNEIMIIIQMIDTRLPPHSTLHDEMDNLYAMISQMDGATIVKQDKIAVGGQLEPFFLATYAAKDSRNRTVPWGHTQLAVQNGPIVLLISYAAPRQIYQKNVLLFQHMIDSLTLTPPQK